MTNTLNNYFKLEKNGTDIKTEVLAGMSTFLMMAYIIVVNPSILSQSGMPFSGVLFATVLVAALSSIAMGLYTNLPYSIAPGMGINAFFTFSIVVGMGIPWETALGAVFVSGLCFIVLSLTGIRTEIVKAMPVSLRLGLAAGIGLFLALIGLESVGFVVADKNTVVGFGGLNMTTFLFFVGLIFTSVLVIKRVTGALIVGIAFTSILSLLVSSSGLTDTPLVTMPHSIFALPAMDTFFKLDIAGALTVAMILPVFSLLFVDLFDSIASFVGIAEAARFVDKDGTPSHVGKALLVDAFSTTISGLFGTSSGTVFVESVAGIEEGGKTGLTAVVTGILFLPFMFLSPLLAFIPAVATAPVLVLVGAFMAQPLRDIDWKNFEDSIPAFLAVIIIPLTYSITQGVIWGFLAYTFIKLITGKAKQIHWIIYGIDTLAIITLVSPMLHH